MAIQEVDHPAKPPPFPAAIFEAWTVVKFGYSFLADISGAVHSGTPKWSDFTRMIQFD